MPKSTKPSPIPDWLKPWLRRPLSGEAEPDTMDYQVASAALSGVEVDDLKKRFDLDGNGVLASIKSVACAVREGKVDATVFDDFPDLRALKLKREKPKSAKPVSEPSTDLAVIPVSNLPEIIPGDEKSFHEFLVAAKEQQARTLVPKTLAALERNLDSLDGMVSNAAISKSLEMHYGVGRRGPGVAIQQNFGGEGGKKEVETPYFFESTILEAEKAEGGSGGETTVFDERLLGQQDDNEA